MVVGSSIGREQGGPFGGRRLGIRSPGAPARTAGRNLRRLEPLGDRRIKPQPFQAGHRQHHGVEPADQPQAGFDRCLGSLPPEGQVEVKAVGPLTERAGADRWPRRQGVERSMDRRDQGVGQALRGGTAARTRPGASWVGRSFRLWTAASTSPSSKAR